MAHQVNLDSVSVRYDVAPVLDSVSVGIDDGDRIGVVGLNGAGKSTLLDVVARVQPPDAGRVSWRTGLQVATVGQRDDYAAGATIREIVVPGSEGSEHDWAALPRARGVIEGLGLLGLGLDRRVAELSGGERRRVGLAAALVSDVDLLILDEPTNHLDMEGVQWLAGYLERFSGAVLTVTHDRWFLDTVCRRTWEVIDGGVEVYDGGYADWVFARADRTRVADATEQRRRNLARKELAWLRRGAPARTSKPRFRIEAANALIDDVPPLRDPVQLVATATSRMGKTVVDLIEATVVLGERRILDGVTWRLAPGGRYGLLGPNGAGKTTLLHTLLGEQDLPAGQRTIGSTVRAAHLSQDLAELDPAARMIQAVSEHAALIRIGTKDLTAGQLLERFGFPARTHKQLVGDLSGGQRRRLQMVRTLMREPNFLLLDEPTNDLDVDTLTALEDLLDGWAGTLVVVSHDRYLLERVTDEQHALLGDGRLRHLPGGVEEYLTLRRTAAEPVSRSSEVGGGRPVERAAEAGAPPSAAARREARKTLERLERQIEALTAREARLHDDLEAHASDFVKARELGDAVGALTEQRIELEARWLQAAELAED